MDNLLQQIRGVVGVTGAMIYDRANAKAATILPASFDEQFAAELKERMVKFIERIHGTAMLRVKMAQAWVVLKVINTHGIMVLAREDLNIATLNLVLKSITIALEQEITSRATGNADRIFQPATAFAMADAVNLISRHFNENLSRSRITQILRASKGELVNRYPVLKLYSVDPNGQVILIRGTEGQIDESVIDAIADWIATIKEYVRRDTVIVGFDIKKITQEIRPHLESVRFYQAFRKAAARQA